jgi:hypothetical protein
MAKDRAILSKNFSEIVATQREFVPELVTQLQGSFKQYKQCFTFDSWSNRSLLWATTITHEFKYRKVFLGSEVERTFDAEFLKQLLTACGLEATHQTSLLL